MTPQGALIRWWDASAAGGGLLHRGLLFSEGDTRQVVFMAGGEGKRLCR